MYAYLLSLTFSLLFGLLIVFLCNNFENNHIESLEKDCKNSNGMLVEGNRAFVCFKSDAIIKIY